MEILKRQDLMQMDFKDFPITGREIGDELERKIKHIEFVYYGQRSDHLHEFFLPGEAKFFPLDRIDEKYDEYRKLAADDGKSEETGFRVDYGILGLLKKSKGTIKQLKIMNPKNLENTLYEAGLISIELALDPLNFGQEKLEKFLDYYDDVLKSSDYKKTISGATNAIKETWQGILGDYETDQPKTIISDEPDDVVGYLPAIPAVKVSEKKPVVPITNQSDLLKALGLNPLESLGELEIKVSDKPNNSVEEVKPLAKPKEYDECKREPVPGSSIYLCKMPDRYQCCEYKGEAFKNPKWASTPRCNLDNYEFIAKAKK